jgi:hypothetical protein
MRFVEETCMGGTPIACLRLEKAVYNTIFQSRGATPHSVIEALSREYGEEIVDEDDPRFWGGETWEEVYRGPRSKRG